MRIQQGTVFEAELQHFHYTHIIATGTLGKASISNILKIFSQTYYFFTNKGIGKNND